MTNEELLKLNEAIEHCDEVIQNLKLKGNCEECMNEHIQLKKWLNDYKELVNNTALKFEELKAGMWIWDNLLKRYFKIIIAKIQIQTQNAAYRSFTVEYFKGLENASEVSIEIIFEDNRFYRKEIYDD